MSQLLASGDQSTGASPSATVHPMNIQGWFPLGLTGFISLPSKVPSKVFSSTTLLKHQFFGAQASFMVQLSHLYMTTGKTVALIIWTLYQLYIYIYPLFFGIPSHLGHHQILNRVPVLYSRFPLVICFMYRVDSIYVSFPITLSSHLLYPLGSHTFVLYICVSISAL